MSLALVGFPAAAQGVPTPAPAPATLTAARTILQSREAALAQDAAAIAGQLGITIDAVERQLKLQQATGPLTDAIAARHAGRLAGIAIGHAPVFRIDVLLTGDEPVQNDEIDIDGERVEVRYVIGAAATHVELVQAITAYQSAIRASLLRAPALGVDQRTGELVAIVSAQDVAREGAEPLRARLAALTGVPVRLRVIDGSARDMADGAEGVAGGMRMMGGVPGDKHQYVCTAGFVVTDGAHSALATAAHCPDTLRVRDGDGRAVTLPFVGQWGWGNQDVQINLSAVPLAPTFFADTARTTNRVVTGAWSRASTRAGDVICHRGERTGYSCSLVELTDFAPAGDLCGGACLPTWTTVAGPACRGGDSGGPVFLGSTAFGILKGGSYRADGSCAFYFYMSTDYIPMGWRLLTAAEPPTSESLAPPEGAADMHPPPGPVPLASMPVSRALLDRDVGVDAVITPRAATR